MSKFRPTDLGYLSTKAPGCLLYMPPEALGKEPKYTEKLDMFSFGVLMLQMVTGEDPNPDMHGIGMVPEVERRKDHIELVPDDHVLKKGILQCLEDNPSKRPTAHDIMALCSDFCRRPKRPLKVCLAHGCYAGSSELAFRCIHGHFSGQTTATIGAAIGLLNYGNRKILLWDTNGLVMNDSNTMYFRGSNGVAVVVDVTRMSSLKGARFHKHLVDSSNPGPPLPAILLANKCDLVDYRTVTAETLAELAEELHCFAYMEVSAKTGQNVKEAFAMLFDKVIAEEAML